MTDVEDQKNAELNEKILACRHYIISRNERGLISCKECFATFMVLLKPRNRKPFFIDWDDEGEKE